MEGSSRNLEASSKLMDLIQNGRVWNAKMDQKRKHDESSSLELRLGPPGDQRYDESALSFKCFTSSMAAVNGNHAQKFCSSEKPLEGHHSSSFLRLPVMAKESSQPCNIKGGDLQSSEKKKAFSIASANTAVPTSGSSSQKRTAPAPVVGWPPIRSFRKNLACSSSLKQAPESQYANSTKTAHDKPLENTDKGMFVKINMDGVPIGRKVDLKAYDSYDKLASAVNELFKGLLAAQRDSSADGIDNQDEYDKSLAGLLDGSGEYTLVYEDNEGDRMLVGDVPWHMFVSTVMRLRVLKSSEVTALNLGSTKQD